MGNLKTKNFDILKETIGFLTAIAYIVLVTMHIFEAKSKLFLLPLILYAANFMIVVDVIVIMLKNNELQTKRNIFWVALYTFCSILGVVLSFMLFRQ